MQLFIPFSYFWNSSFCQSHSTNSHMTPAAKRKLLVVGPVVYSYNREVFVNFSPIIKKSVHNTYLLLPDLSGIFLAVFNDGVLSQGSPDCSFFKVHLNSSV